MKLLFLCGSLENGKDGVGDYTRRLAGELIRQGHSASIISLNDNHINRIEKTEQESDSTKISVLRLPAQLSNKERYKKAEEYINAFNPEWLSLQYVPYSFQKRGLPFGLAKQLQKIGKGRKWHVMFHELWVGSDKNISFKLQIIRTLQKVIIKKTVMKLRPCTIHTNTTLYNTCLMKIGINNKILPLFSNIQIKEHLINKRENIDNELKVVHFGSFSDDVSSFRKQILWLAKYAIYQNKTLQIIIIGNFENLENNITVIRDVAGNLCEINVCGFLSERSISKIFSTADIGISRANHKNYEKSGSTIAMLEYGLPVLLKGEIPSVKIKENVYFYTDNFSEKLRTFPTNRINAVAKQFINELN
jgi:hypothetical protein